MSSSTQRGDFGFVSLGACYGAGARWRAVACVAGELGVIRGVRALRFEPANEVLSQRIESRVAGVLTARLGYRGSSVQPELEISGVGTEHPFKH